MLLRMMRYCRNYPQNKMFLGSIQAKACRQSRETQVQCQQQQQWKWYQAGNAPRILICAVCIQGTHTHALLKLFLLV